jgi:glc operon protein GlcG
MIHPEIEKLISIIEDLIPVYIAIPEDLAISGGNASLCIISEDGNMYGKVFGSDKLRGRETYQIAWTKASQVWITGYDTFEYEKKVFNGEIDYHTFGIRMPDFVGYKGGQSATLRDGTKLAIGFSGFRGTTDLEIVLKAVGKVNNQVTI